MCSTLSSIQNNNSHKTIQGVIVTLFKLRSGNCKTTNTAAFLNIVQHCSVFCFISIMFSMRTVQAWVFLLYFGIPLLPLGITFIWTFLKNLIIPIAFVLSFSSFKAWGTWTFSRQNSAMWPCSRQMEHTCVSFLGL